MQPLLFLDTETTDLEDGRLVELAYAVRQFLPIESGEITHFRVKPPVPISIDAMATHHITEIDVLNQPSFQEHPLYRTVSDIVRDSVLIAHNAQYDIEVLKREGIEVGKWIDTKRVAMHLFPDSQQFKLQFLRYYLGCKVDGVPHSAEGDVNILMAVFQKITNCITQEYPTQSMEDVVAKAIELSTAPVLLKLAPYRLKKWKGTPFSEVNRLDRAYLEWAYKQDWDDEDLKHTLEHWIRIRSL